VNMRDPSRGVVASPRIVSETRRGTGPDTPVKEPEIELDSGSLSLVQAIANIERSM
jgi:hypothetical protein